MKYKIYYEYRDNVCYEYIEADNFKQAQARFAIKNEDRLSFVEAIKTIIEVELCEKQR